MMTTKHIFFVVKNNNVTQNHIFFKIKRFIAKIIEIRHNFFVIFVFILIDDDDDFVKISNTFFVFQNIVCFYVELQREKKIQHVEIVDITKINELKIKIKRL